MIRMIHTNPDPAATFSAIEQPPLSNEEFEIYNGLAEAMDSFVRVTAYDIWFSTLFFFSFGYFACFAFSSKRLVCLLSFCFDFYWHGLLACFD